MSDDKQRGDTPELEEHIVQALSKIIAFQLGLNRRGELTPIVQEFSIIMGHYVLRDIEDEDLRAAYLEAAEEECDARMASRGREGRGERIDEPINEFYL